jgi:hypothetical protein
MRMNVRPFGSQCVLCNRYGVLTGRYVRQQPLATVPLVLYTYTKYMSFRMLTTNGIGCQYIIGIDCRGTLYYYICVLPLFDRYTIAQREITGK